MKQNELYHGRKYAIQLPGTIAQATYMGTVGDGEGKRLKFFVPTLNLTHEVPTAHSVVGEWENYVAQTEGTILQQGTKAAIFDAQTAEINALILFFRTIDVDAGLMSVLVVENDEPVIQPALYIRHKDVQRISNLLKQLSVPYFNGEHNDSAG